LSERAGAPQRRQHSGIVAFGFRVRSGVRHLDAIPSFALRVVFIFVVLHVRDLASARCEGGSFLLVTADIEQLFAELPLSVRNS
jgi:hypothetical protein